MKAIQKELGRDDQSADIDEIRAKIKKIGLSQDAHEKVEKELNRLEQMPPLSSEAAISRNYIDWIMSLPWKKETKDTISIRKAEHILENTHAGLKKAKERIIEFLAAKKFSKNLERSPILCLVGPPGVGKTSLAKSVAESLGREFVRISLGGVRDEAEIRGHRRTYIGALPGKIIQSMKKANSINPVILLDEIDKMSHDVHGDPAAALLEVLDPEQNKNFVDHFLDTEYDLSRVMFIATANVADHIPYALYDRLEMIPLSGYTIEEKNAIGKKFLVPRNLTEHSLDKTQFKLPDESINTIINHYTKESGVRQLERIITKLMRKSIQELLKDKNKKSITVTNQLILEWLGNHIFKPTSLSDRADRIGLATGLAWTEVGGDVLEIETTALAGKGTVTLTGQLGDVMQESAQAAISYIRSRAEDLNIKPSFYANRDIHVHLPEGATPKDGPSAGITMCCAIVSALTKNALRPDIVMTGEITLQGRVLAIGGLKEKLLAARQHGFKTVIIPDENKDDLTEIRKEIAIDDLNIVPVKNMDQVLETAFVKSPFAKKNIIRKKKTSSKKIKPARKLARLTA
jgi:ATP-dependent Lon protease